MLASSVAGTAVAGVIEFFDEDRDEWFAVTRAVTTIDFTGFRNDTFITNQYEDLGVLFLDGDDNIICCEAQCYPSDGSGLDGNEAIHLLFDSPQRWIAADFPGFLQFELRSQGKLIYESSWFGQSGCGHFGGLLLTEAFEEAIVTDPFGGVNLADLHFGFLPLGDLDGDGEVGISDFLEVLGAWGPCPIPCPADVDGNDDVNIADFLALLAAWGPNPGHPADVDGDGFVGINDLLDLLATWGFCPPPIGCLADLDCDGAVGINDLLTLLANWT
ncbi:MAG: hypothetical protein V3S08_09070 [Phycisphaerales bacterium]